MPLRIFKINKTKEPDDKKNVDLSDIANGHSYRENLDEILNYIKYKEL